MGVKRKTKKVVIKWPPAVVRGKNGKWIVSKKHIPLSV